MVGVVVVVRETNETVDFVNTMCTHLPIQDATARLYYKIKVLGSPGRG